MGDLVGQLWLLRMVLWIVVGAVILLVVTGVGTRLLARRRASRGAGRSDCRTSAAVEVDALVARGPTAAPAITAGLTSDDPRTRTIAAVAIGRARHRDQTPALRALVDHEEDPVVLTAAVGALGLVSGPGDVVVVLPLTAAGRPRSVRLAAVLALGALGGAAAVDGLADLLGDEDRWLAELAAEVLGDVGPAGPAALEARVDDPGHVGEAAAYGLAMYRLRRDGP
ncbi:HEAT repeat domain-containing protein [Janibacter sp. G349]|uniref:HEAT repeat domain-containing protein n=1 Tax=Janibacter sp. G349 TaxID=3405424 RepID=UPI003B77FF80